MIRNERFQNGVCLDADIYDLENRWYRREEAGVIVQEREMTLDEIRMVGPQPLDSDGRLAALLAVLEVVSVEDAANAVGLTPQDLVNEAQGWAAASGV